MAPLCAVNCQHLRTLRGSSDNSFEPRIPPACTADRSASRYAARAQIANPAGLHGGSFGFSLRRPRPDRESRRLARRIVRLLATIGGISEKPNDPPDKPTEFAELGGHGCSEKPKHPPCEPAGFAMPGNGIHSLVADEGRAKLFSLANSD